jgi:hypothetical protein
MTQPSHPQLAPGHVYRTKDLAQWSANPPRLAKRLVKEGQLVQFARGLFASPKRSRFGDAPPADEELLRAFLDDSPFVITGPQRWNALGLGTTALFATPLVYNLKRSGTFTLGRRAFELRRVAFPSVQTPEWFVVDLFENAGQAGASRDALTSALARAFKERRFDKAQLVSTAQHYATRATQFHLNTAIEASAQ